MSAVTLITLGVADVAEATAFYEEARLREVEDGELRKRERLSGRGVVLALWGRDAQRTDANAGELWNGNGGIAVAQNVASEADVDALMAKAEAAGAHILKPAAKSFWGGCDGYFADSDGHLWEIAFNPHWALDEDGRIKLPE